MQNRSWYALEGLLGDHTVVVDLQFTGSGSGDGERRQAGGRESNYHREIGGWSFSRLSFCGVGVLMWGGVDDRHFSRRIYSLNRMMVGIDWRKLRDPTVACILPSVVLP